MKVCAIASKKPETASKERFQRIHRALRDRICLLEYLPGQQLGEKELAEEFGTSRTPIRRVLGRLEAEGLIERRHGIGTIITEVHPDALAQVIKLRIELTSLMGRLAPLQYGPKEISIMEAYCSDCRELEQSPDPAQFLCLHISFDMDLFAMIGNKPLREISERLYYQTTRSWAQSVLSMDDVRPELRNLNRKINDILGALRVGDHAAVGDYCRVHISMSFIKMTHQ